MPKRLIICALASLVAAMLATASSADAPTRWTRVTDATGDSNDEVAHVRTQDGVLHVVWRRRLGPNREAVAHTTVTPDGRVGASSIAASPFSAITNPDLTMLPDGSLRTLFGAQTTITETSGVRSASKAPGATTWSLDPARVSASTVTPDHVGAAVAAGGVPIFSWIKGPELFVHAGLSAGDPDQELGPSQGCCFNRPNLATSGGQTLLAFHSNIRGQAGIFVRPVSPAIGAARLAPGSATNRATVAVDQRVPITARAGAPGIYLAYCGGYPECHSALLWRVGTPRAKTVGKGGDVELVNIAAGPEGRLWVMWEDADSKRLYARRSDRSGGCMGEIVGVRRPPGMDSVWTLNGEGSLGPLDVFANAAPSATARAATWHTQIFPGLTVAARSGRKVRIKVTDACDPVAGAKVRIGGRTLSTDRQGVATVDLPAGSFTAEASKAGYTGGAARVQSR